jgi:ribonuclease P protein component
MTEQVGRLTRRADFLKVAESRRRFAAPGLVLQAAPAESCSLRVGFTASRKVGGAVVRNRVKRRLRALALELLPAHAKPGHDYVLVGRVAGVARQFDDLRRDLETALRRLDLWREAGSANLT